MSFIEDISSKINIIHKRSARMMGELAQLVRALDLDLEVTSSNLVLSTKANNISFASSMKFIKPRRD